MELLAILIAFTLGALVSPFVLLVLIPHSFARAARVLAETKELQKESATSLQAVAENLQKTKDNHAECCRIAAQVSALKAEMEALQARQNDPT